LFKQLTPGIQAFTTFYNSKHNGRKLIWLYSRSRGELVTNGFPHRYTFQVSAYEIAILLMYNTADVYTVQEIMDFTRISSETLLQILGILIKANLLQCLDTELSPTSDIILFLGYKNKKFRVNLNLPLRTEVKREQEQTEASVEEDRKVIIQACIVRIMKMRKTLGHQELMGEVMTQVAPRFKPSVPNIKVN